MGGTGYAAITLPNNSAPRRMLRKLWSTEALQHWTMTFPHDERVMQLRQLARRLEEDRPSPERDELLARTRLRLVEIEAGEELGPRSSMPALSDEPILDLGNRFPKPSKAWDRLNWHQDAGRES